MSYSDDFPTSVRSKGAAELARERVNLVRQAETSVQAFVQNWRVKLSAASIVDAQFETECSCSKAKAGELCKHIWATVLKVEESYPDFLQFKSRALAPPADLNVAPKPERKVQTKKRREVLPVYPEDVAEALKYFADNGFEFEVPLSLEPVHAAKRKLAKVFHPDRGGSHHEVVSLNANYAVIEYYLKG